MSIPSHFSQAYQRFFFLHGHTDDEFCPPTLGILTLEEMLHSHLRQLGYQRLVFYNGRQKIYFHDGFSRQSSRPDLPSERYEEQESPVLPHMASVSEKHAPSTVSRIGTGPLGNFSLLNASSTPDSTQVETRLSPVNLDSLESSLQLGNMNDSEVVGFIARCMEDEHLKTAVIFTDGLDFITHFDAPAQRHMSGVLTRCGQLPSSNHNIYLFILPHTELQNIRRLLERHEWHFLLNQFFDQDYTPTHRVIFIGPPRQDEVHYLLNYWSLKRQLPTAWRYLPHSSERLARQLCGEGKSLKSLSYELQRYQSLNGTSLEQLSGATEQLPALQRLQGMRGLEVVTDKIERLLARHQEQAQIQPTSIPNRSTVARLLPNVARVSQHTNLHLVLKGNPGTGKTTVAQLIAEVYRDAGLLELGHLIKVSREDLVAGYVGQTAIQTAQKISDALGGVLFIDEAYRLNEGDDNDFGREAIETIMEAMSNHLGAFAVIIAGYPQEIERFLDANPGLRRRFSLANTLEIPDYPPETLHHIFSQLVTTHNHHIAPELGQRLPDFFANWHANRDERTFGNAGEVVNLYQEMDERRIVRTRGLPDEQRYQLAVDDVPERLQSFLAPRTAANLDTVLHTLNSLVGLPKVKQKIRSLINSIKVQQLRGEQTQLVAGHYVFTGNAGTGKSTVARLLGQVFFSLGLLRKGHLVEAERTDLVGGVLQSSAIQTRQLINKSLEGVLFINDAHQLIQGELDETGREAVKALLTEMEQQKDRLCVIFSGHPAAMQHFLQQASGISARLSAELQFENYQATDLLGIFQHMAAEKNLQLADELSEHLLSIFQQWETQANPNFGNAREVRRLLDEMITRQNDRLVETGCLDPVSLYQLTLADLPNV